MIVGGFLRHLQGSEYLEICEDHPSLFLLHKTQTQFHIKILVKPNKSSQ